MFYFTCNHNLTEQNEDRMHNILRRGRVYRKIAKNGTVATLICLAYRSTGWTKIIRTMKLFWRYLSKTLAEKRQIGSLLAVPFLSITAEKYRNMYT